VLVTTSTRVGEKGESEMIEYTNSNATVEVVKDFVYAREYAKAHPGCGRLQVRMRDDGSRYVVPVTGPTARLDAYRRRLDAATRSTSTAAARRKLNAALGR